MLGNQKVYKPQTPRGYQIEAIESVRGDWLSGSDAVLVAMATGTGKTTVASDLLKQVIDPDKKRVLVVAHTEEIVFQLFDRISNQFAGELNTQLYCGLRMLPGIGIVMGKNDAPEARIVVATRQSLHKKRLKEVLRHGAVDILMIDEAHHAVGDNSYGAIVDTVRANNPDVKIVGFTATPKRTDRKALKTVWDKVSYSYLIPDAIADGWLTPATRIKVETRVSLDKVKTRAGDYSQKQMMSILKAANWLELSTKAFMEYVVDSDRRSLAFMPSVQMSKDFTSALKKQGVKIEHLDGTTPKDQRRAILSAYARGELQAISNCLVLTEGFDAPATDAIFLARPTRSPTLFTQILGRGLRPHPGKVDCLLIDLAVQDTRALQMGTLLGRVLVCQECGAEYLYGLPQCPRCGAVYVPEEREIIDDEPMLELPYRAHVGSGLLANIGSIFDDAFAAWFPGADGYFSVTMGFDEGTLVIVPPLTDDQYRLAHVPKERDRPVRFVDQNSDIASLIMDGESYLKQHGGAANTTDKNAAWRSHAASAAQIKLLRSLGVPAPENCSKGAAAQMITHALSVQRAVNESWSVDSLIIPDVERADNESR